MKVDREEARRNLMLVKDRLKTILVFAEDRRTDLISTTANSALICLEDALENLKMD